MSDRRFRPAVWHGAYYVATGLWPLVHMRSFLVATGPKKELWLVKTFGSLVAAVGASLLLEGLRERRGSSPPSTESALLGLGCAGALAASEVWYVLRRRIAPTYLLDAAVELALIAAWQQGLARAR